MKNGKPIPKEQWLDQWNRTNPGLVEVWSTDGMYNDGATKWHRTDGPAVVYDTGEIHWLLDGRNLPFTDFCYQANLSDEDISIIILKYGDNV